MALLKADETVVGGMVVGHVPSSSLLSSFGWQSLLTCLGHSNDSVMYRVPIVTSHTCFQFKVHALNKLGLVMVIIYALM